MSSVGAAPCAAVSVSSARAEASRRNGAKSRGPRTAEGKARSAQNALKHGLRAEKYVVLPDEDRNEFAALEAALEGELAPEGALQRLLARRVACAAWRLMRAERLEVELFAEHHIPDGSLGLALIRDGNGTRSFETLLRYRGAAQAELWRALRTLKALQAEPAAALPTGASVLMLQPKRGRTGAGARRAFNQAAGQVAPRAHPIEPEHGGNPGESAPAPAAGEPDLPAGPARARPNKPEPAPRGPACAPTARPPAERTQSWAVRGRSGGRAESETDGARSDRTAPGAPEIQLRCRPQPSRSTP
jgi:hypothetical protein